MNGEGDANGEGRPADGTKPLQGPPVPTPTPTPVPALFPAHRRLRLLTYLLLLWAALGIFLAGGNEISADYQLSTAKGLFAGALQAAAVLLAIRRPGSAWALSLATTIVTAAAVRPNLADTPLPGPNWPWTTPAVLAHALVFLLLALRLSTRRAAGALAVTALATFVLQGVVGAQRYSGTGTVAIAVFAATVLVGIALRGRSEARSQLVEQETITAEERARRTLLEERSRIARELHDVVAHHMSVISIQAQVAPHLVENPSEELKENLAGIRDNALEALAELRRVLGVLRSENPEDPYGLGEAATGSAPDSPQPTLDRLDALIENTRAAGLDVVTSVERPEGGPPAYPPGLELSAYRIVQEALSNALRHAPGSTVRVEIHHFPRGLYIGVINSRPQQPVPPSPGVGHGLLGMRERAAMLGGHVTATRTLHGGFAVTAFLPKDGAQDGAQAATDAGGRNDAITPPTGEETP
ncbi:sensor histidine kinase [Streptomyces sp. MMG1533]|uniref:sensor histidine kinase n=1 Tax=Streptomyces sp. MMG1533 TaxID=1415546 RepID=UPI000AFBDF4C|nr:sensor histidine kinase [Streptomyces sp. MMG1533]